MKNLKTFEGFISEAKEKPFDRLNRIADEVYGEFGFTSLDTEDMEELIDMKKADKIADKEYGEFGFTSLDSEDMEEVINKNPKLVKEQVLNETGPSDYVLEPYHFRNAGISKDSLPARGESIFCVIRHDLVNINGMDVYLGGGNGGMRVSIVGLYDTEDEARAAFKAEIKKKVDGVELSVALGDLFNRKFGQSFEEIESHIAKGRVK